MVKRCPKCKSDERNNRNLVMLINECGHPLCRNCVDSIYSRSANPCIYDNCGRILKRNNFRDQLFDDPKIDRESYIRKKLAKTFNLHEDNFSDLRAFNDYLERVEEIVWNLCNDIDVEETEAAIKKFREEHSAEIERNRKRANPDDIWINEQLAEEAHRAKKLQGELDEEVRAARQKVVPNSSAIIDQLRETDLPAEVILDRQRKIKIEADMAEKQKQDRKKQEKDRKVHSTFGQLRRSGKAYVHKNPLLPINGPKMPTPEEVEEAGYLKHICRATKVGLAGGYTPLIGLSRAILEARQDLLAI